MFRLLLSWLLIFFFLVSSAQTKVLFIGNSYTSANNLPWMISQIYNSEGENYYFDSNTPGGSTFKQHCSLSHQIIAQGDWDYVVLQEQSQLPAFPDGQFIAESYPYAKQLCEMIEEYNPDSKIVFYMTWGRKYGDQINCQNFEPLCTYEGMDSMLNLRYTLMAADNKTLLSPVGAVWRYIRDNHPQVELYSVDGSHPSYFGSFIAALCFYTIFESKNPLQITWNGEVDATDFQIAKNAVKIVVFDSLDKWNFIKSSESGDLTPIFNHNFSPIKIYPNPVSDLLTISGLCADYKYSVEIFDYSGRRLSCTYGSDSKIVNLNTSHLPNGFYILMVKTAKKTYSSKFTVLH